MPQWSNWQPRHTQNVVLKGVSVRVRPWAKYGQVAQWQLHLTVNQTPRFRWFESNPAQKEKSHVQTVNRVVRLWWCRKHNTFPLFFCLCSSAVEHFLGKEGVNSPILFGGFMAAQPHLTSNQIRVIGAENGGSSPSAVKQFHSKVDIISLP